VDPLALAARMVAILQAAPVSTVNSVTKGQNFNWTCRDIATEAVVLTETGQMCKFLRYWTLSRAVTFSAVLYSKACSLCSF
jgi:hypothetical protein